MGLGRKDKVDLVEDLSSRLLCAQVLFVAEHRGVLAADMTALRANARNAGVYLRVFKNTLAKRAVAGTPFEKLSKDMVGPLLYGLSDDPVSLAKVFSDFAKLHQDFCIKCGFMLPSSWLQDIEIKALADLPGRDELLSRLFGTMLMPCVTFIRTAREVPARFARVLNAVCEQKGSQGGQ